MVSGELTEPVSTFLMYSRNSLKKFMHWENLWCSSFLMEALWLLIGKRIISRLSLKHGIGGQAAGQALADVIFGDYNPGGRLPVTFYKSVSDLLDFTDYKMENRTYRCFKGEPLYPFGYGLSLSLIH